MRRSSFSIRVLLAALALTVGTAGATLADEVPVWPHEQQSRLRDVEAQVLEVQRQLANARRKNDLPAVETLGAEFKTLQKERMALIRATEGQLPSE